MQSSVPFSLAIIGTGRVAADHATAIQQVAGCRLISVFDRTSEVATAFASRFQTCVAASVESMIQDSRPDAVIVCTPPATHFEFCRFFLSHHIPVLCEKPLVIQTSEAKILQQLAITHQTPLVLATKFRFVSDIQHAKKLIEENFLGNVFRAEITYEAEIDMADRWNSQPEISGGGVLIDNGPHATDLARYLFGPIATVKAWITFQKSWLVEDTAELELISETGVNIKIRLSWSKVSSTDWFLKLTGRQGECEIGWRHSHLKMGSGSPAQFFGSGYDKRSAFSEQLLHFVRAVRGESTFSATMDDAISAVTTVEAGYRSTMTGKFEPVRISPFPKDYDSQDSSDSNY